MWQRVREYLRELLRALIGQPAGTWAATQNATQRAAELLAQALAEEEPSRRVTLLREALSAGERLGGESGDIVVMEASLHLGERPCQRRAQLMCCIGGKATFGGKGGVQPGEKLVERIGDGAQFTRHPHRRKGERSFAPRRASWVRNCPRGRRP